MAKAKSETVTVSVSSAPKKSTSAYMLFCKEERSNVKTQLPDLKNTEVVTELAKRWRSLGENDPGRKDRLVAIAKTDQELYKQQKAAGIQKEAAAVAPVPEGAKKPRKKKSAGASEEKAAPPPPPAAAAKKAKKPKKTADAGTGGPAKKTRVTGYINFSNENRERTKAANPGMAPNDIMRQLALQWNALSDAEKEKFKLV